MCFLKTDCLSALLYPFASNIILLPVYPTNKLFYFSAVDLPLDLIAFQSFARKTLLPLFIFMPSADNKPAKIGLYRKLEATTHKSVRPPTISLCGTHSRHNPCLEMRSISAPLDDNFPFQFESNSDRTHICYISV